MSRRALNQKKTDKGGRSGPNNIMDTWTDDLNLKGHHENVYLYIYRERGGGGRKGPGETRHRDQRWASHTGNYQRKPIKVSAAEFGRKHGMVGSITDHCRTKIILMSISNLPGHKKAVLASCWCDIRKVNTSREINALEYGSFCMEISSCTR